VSATVAVKRSGLRRAVSTAADHAPWLVDAYRLARRPNWEVAIRRDLARTGTEAAFLREIPAPRADAPVALLGLYRDDIFDAKVGLVLAAALAARGFEPVVLLPTTRARRVPRYARAFGVERVAFASAVALTPSEIDECEVAAAGFLSAGIDFGSIKGWRFRGRVIGSHVLSTVIRTTFDGSPDFANEDVRNRLGIVLETVLRNVVRSERVLETLEPSVVLVEEANYAINGPLVDAAVARGVDVIQTISWNDEALLSKRITATNRRVDAKSVSPESLAVMEREPWTAALDATLEADFDHRYHGTHRDADLRHALGIDNERPTAVIFGHVLWDASLFYGTDLFDNYSDWLVQTVAAAIDNPSVNWLVKAHPSSAFRVSHGDIPEQSTELRLLRDCYPVLPAHVRVLPPETGISARSLYAFADYGVTVRGTPGIEMPCFGKPVLTAGTGSYAGLGFTYDSASREEFLTRLAELHTYGPLPDDMTTRARRYAYTLFVRRPWKPRSFALEVDYAERGWHPLDRNVVLRARSLDKWHAVGDLDHWANWVIGSDDTDYTP
jgi:hypothetical protein